MESEANELIEIVTRAYAHHECRRQVLARYLGDIPHQPTHRLQAAEDFRWLADLDDTGAALGEWLRAVALFIDTQPAAEVLRRAAADAARLVPPTEPLLERAAADAATVPYTPPGDGRAARLDEVFVPLPCRLGGERITDVEDHLDALSGGPIRCLLVGRPGSGKSTLLRHLTGRLVEAARDRTQRRPWMPERPVPALVSIGPQASIADAEALRRAIASRTAHDLRGVPSDRVVLLVDGIDDIPSPDDRRQTLRALEALAARRPKMRVVACARRSSLTGYHADAFARLTLARLDDEHRRALVERWLGWFAPDALSSASRLIERLRQSDLRGDAETPLILAGLCDIWSRDGHIKLRPSAILDRLLDRHPIERGRLRQFARRWWDTHRLTEREATALLGDAFDALHGPGGLLDRVEDDALSNRCYAFAHRLLGEHLVAGAMVEDDVFAERVLTRAEDDPGQRAIVERFADLAQAMNEPAPSRRLESWVDGILDRAQRAVEASAAILDAVTAARVLAAWGEAAPDRLRDARDRLQPRLLDADAAGEAPVEARVAFWDAIEPARHALPIHVTGGAPGALAVDAFAPIGEGLRILRWPVLVHHFAPFVRDDATTPRHWFAQRHHETRPVGGIAFAQAEAWCAWASAHLPGRVRLPTVAEWQAAGRPAGDRRPLPWGEDDDRARRNGGGNCHGITPLGVFPGGCSHLAVWDLVGNVQEWCQPDRQRAGDRIHPTCGGSWSNPGSRLHLDAVKHHTADTQYGDFGFRVVWAPPR